MIEHSAEFVLPAVKLGPQVTLPSTRWAKTGLGQVWFEGVRVLSNLTP